MISFCDRVFFWSFQKSKALRNALLRLMAFMDTKSSKVLEALMRSEDFYLLVKKVLKYSRIQKLEEVFTDEIKKDGYDIQ